MQELRLLFSPSDGNEHRISLTAGDGKSIGVEVPFTPFLTEENFADLRWYLETYMELPDGGAVVRAERIEAEIARWGHQLHDAVFSALENKAALKALLDAPEPRELTIATSDPALLRLPWELMADAAGSLALRVSIRRQLSEPEKLLPREVQLPLRILYIVSRPENAGFIDPRVTTKALFAALDPLGAAIQLDFCRPPTLKRMGEMLREAQQAGDPYDVVHFDGHGTFMPQTQLGALCFEQSDDGTGDSKTDLVPADQFGNLLAQHQIPLVVLEACRSAEMKSIVFRSVAPRLIQAGVGSVLSMGHAVHVEAAKILLDRFYRELVNGTTIGHAVAQGRSALMTSPARWLEYGPGARTLRLQDWFLPHLYQRGLDDALLPPDLAEKQTVRQFDLFLSHNHNDSARVEAIARTLSEKHGLRVWLDKWECDPGKLEPQCEAGIRNSRFTVVAGSQTSLNSKWVEWEINKHLELNPGSEGNRLLPLKFEKLQLPPHLDDLLWVDISDPVKDNDSAAKIARLIRSTDAADASRLRGFRPPARQRDEHGPFPPAPTYGFHGRARELLLLERQFRTQRGIVLHAMGGMGKTTLATEAADWWTRSGLFRDGACFVSFEQFTSAERVVQVLGCYVHGDKFNQLPASEQRKRAIEIMQQRAVLMVWDSFESALPQFNDGAAAIGSPYTDDERSRLAELFRDLTSGPGKGAVLVTCRPGDTGLPGARRHELHGLARADSLWLLAEILQKHDLKLSDPRLTRDKLDPLLRDLADHPLSLELVGPHLKTLTPEAIRADFATLLTKFQQEAPLGPDGKPGRNSSLLASLEFSRRHLSQAAQDALPWLGLFNRGVFEHLLLDVSQIKPDSWEPIRRELQSIALVRLEDDIQINNRPFLRFHPTLATACITETSQSKPGTKERFLSTYSDLAQNVRVNLVGSNPQSAMHILALEDANWREALRMSLELNKKELAALLGEVVLSGLERDLRLSESDALTIHIADQLRGQRLSKESAIFECHRARILARGGAKDHALEALTTLVSTLWNSAEFDNEFPLALAIHEIGRVQFDAGRVALSVPVLAEACERLEDICQRRSLSEYEKVIIISTANEARLNLANALRSNGRLDEGKALVERTIESCAENKDLNGVARSRAFLGRFYTELGQFEESEANYELALSGARQAGNRSLEAAIIQHFGLLALRTKKMLRATQLLHQAINLFQSVGDSLSLARTYNLLSKVECEHGRFAEAIVWAEKCRSIAQFQKDTETEAAAIQSIGIVIQKQVAQNSRHSDIEGYDKRLVDAIDHLSQSRLLWLVLGNQQHMATSSAALSEVLLISGKFDDAYHYANESRQLRESLDLPVVNKNYHTLSEIAEARGDSAAAAEWARKRDAKRAELQRLARGPGQGDGGLPGQLLEPLQQLAIACAQAQLNEQPLGPAEEEALANLDQFPPPLPDFATALRALATGTLTTVPTTLPAELQQLLTAIIEAVRKAKG
ncbi:MAG: CHAT domain-containing protein [Verrucomicrobiaceae bacterium]|nr:CHAT domain-containing protein [Verrucomicrobiaceae bacterium]